MADTELLERERDNIGTSGGGMGDLDASMDELEASGEGPPIPDDDDDEVLEQDPHPDMDSSQMLDPPRAQGGDLVDVHAHEDESPRGRHRRRPVTRRSAFAEKVSEDFADILAGINFEPGEHKISVYRIEPEFDAETGKRITGLCETFRRPIALDEIQKKFGGGTYKIIVTGPREDTGKGSQIKANKMVDIVGEPIIPTNARQKRLEEDQARAAQDNQIDRLMERSDRRDLEAKQEIRQMNDTVLQLVTKMAERPKEDPTAAMTPILTMMREDSARRDREAVDQRERDEARRREDRDRAEAQRAQERDERQRRDDADNRRHEADMKRQDQQFTLQVESMKAEAASSKNQMETVLAFMQKNDSEKESRSQEQLKMQMQMVTQISDVQRSSMEMQMQNYADQLKELRSNKDKDGFLDTFAKFQQVQELLNPGEPEKDTWEKVADRLGEAAPALFTGLSALRGPAQQQLLPHQQPLLQPGQQMMPGSVTVVEDIDQFQPEAALGTPVKGHQAQMGGVEHAPQQHGGPQFVEVDKEARKLQTMDSAASPEEEEAPDDALMHNDFVEFMAYPNDASNEEVLTMLVKNLDLAMQRGLDEDAMYDKCMATLPQAPKGFLKMLPAQTLLSFVENNVPERWALRSIDGDVKLRAVHEKLVTSG